ncbi:MAG: lipoyl(octanoyl) transferase LipB [Cellvibrionales bacterium]|nr:lipoyl(octanoyl) transferase LipB [Cellvibrionales bacterium]MBK8675244.1 lipoyl(octanoyl) transferase LipB [Cellvibrionales bacterium]TXH49429.1 MAG: lipoyl(octanoyl) transferase LipB [Cellvibrionales bacterium]HRF87404.1 lipoyl(octanoyl) transferase LipB [Pseudomonadales bacterium]
MAKLIVRQFAERQHYADIWHRMQQFTATRDEKTADELWLLEHHPVYTQGLAGKAEHVLCAGDVPVVQTDRGGQVTWHGPGQLMVYALLDVRRLQWGARTLVSALENMLIGWLYAQGLTAFAQRNAPGVYLCGKDNTAAKIAALGLRITKKGCYHGMAINVSNDLAPFSAINPCGVAGQRVTRLDQWLSPLPTRLVIEQSLVKQFADVLHSSSVTWETNGV